MKKEFEKFLISKGYKTQTPSGNPSTVYDYIKRVEKVCTWEKMTLNELGQKISNVVNMYERGGEKAELGKKSHNAVINALRRFYEFIEKKPYSFR